MEISHGSISSLQTCTHFLQGPSSTLMQQDGVAFHVLSVQLLGHGNAKRPSGVSLAQTSPVIGLTQLYLFLGTLFWKGHHRVPSEESTNVYTATSLFPCAWLYFLSSPTEAFPVSQESCSTLATGQILGWMGAAVCYSIFRCSLVLSLFPSRYL